MSMEIRSHQAHQLHKQLDEKRANDNPDAAAKLDSVLKDEKSKNLDPSTLDLVTKLRDFAQSQAQSAGADKIADVANDFAKSAKLNLEDRAKLATALEAHVTIDKSDQLKELRNPTIDASSSNYEAKRDFSKVGSGDYAPHQAEQKQDDKKYDEEAKSAALMIAMELKRIQA